MMAAKTNKKLLSLFLLLLLPSLAAAQLCEDFSDGDFHNIPSWTGDTADFRINSNRQLQLYADNAGTSQMAFRYSLPASDTIEWQFWLRLGFTPTQNNYATIALYADTSDLTAATQLLTLKVTDPANNQKNICLFQNDSLLFTYPYHPRLNNNRLRFRIRMAGQQQLLMAIDTIGDPDSIRFTDCGTVPTAYSILPDQTFFGLFCQYTSSRAHLIYLDDIGINCNGTTPSGNDKVDPGEVLINEVLFNPVPGGADYVELYNNSDRSIPLAKLFLAEIDDSTVTTLHPISSYGNIEAHSLIAVTTDAADIATHYNIVHPDRLIQADAMPAYPDKQGTVAVATIDSALLDRFDYNESMHSRLLSDKEGVSLERRSTQRPTQEAANWFSASSTAGYGTPTAPNSQSHEILFADNDFTATPTLFSPDGDGYNDLLDITYSLQLCNLAANITVFSRHGTAVRHLAKATLLGCSGDIVWDGTDDNGQPCSRGSYLVVVETYNENGTRQSWRRTVNLVRK